ncbi:hypothetical protein MACH17_15010 [Phaeobacter inhibens]|uniref:hypothetical protein n=1 Tax=Phaeobacter inhibens TaxID=221822 RepID=UPI00276A7543|nr:hypothetical protein [Phaeobacter inhibens]GLO69984.1 hypothetical protein MACH17_15010 [Phaeobacter inhibens]
MSTDSKQLYIAPPDPDRPPMAANAFHAARTANTTLTTPFPYVTEECLVPGIALFQGDLGDAGMGHFHHTNSVDETFLCLASKGSAVRTGTLMVGPRSHHVGSFFENERDPENVMLMIVVQRQSAKGVRQHEGLTFHCHKCQNVMLDHEFDVENYNELRGPVPGYFAPLETLLKSFEFGKEYNDSVDVRTCSKCGHVHDKFPMHVWGWTDYHTNYEASEHCRDLLIEATSA